MPAHKNDTKDFNSLSYSEQANSLTSQINNLKTQILKHKKIAQVKNKEDPTEKFIKQLQKLIDELKIN